MRFAFISSMSVAPWGGSEELWSQAALRLRAAGHEVAASVCWWPSPSRQVEALQEQGVELFLRKSAVQSTLFTRARRKIQRLGEKKPAEFAWLQNYQPDLTIISQGGNADGLDWMKFCKEARFPFVVICQCNTEAWWPTDGAAAVMSEVFSAAKQLFFVSRTNLELCERQIGRRLPNALLARNPFNVSPLAMVPWPVETGTWRLACVARLDPPAKGQDLLLDVLAHSRWCERAIEVNFYGTGPYAEGLKQLADFLRLKSIRFHGHVDDISSIWAGNHILVLPSRFEGLPLALVEAMWCGRPAIVTNVAGNAELCADGETGFVAAAPAVELLGQTLEVAWDHRHKWSQMGAAARARVETLIPKDPVGLFTNQLLSSVGVRSSR
ncbi:MAG TPA: glycosyltransferase family 4 protein [Candidatus Angelobacter sp.]|nr:glycosyltransferase family 4 protein [Candidatus Angelobacter sp.]